MAYRIGITSYCTEPAQQEIINDYKKQLEKLGYECEVLLFVDKKEQDNQFYLQSFCRLDLERRSQMPNSPRTDRFIHKRYDILLNLFLNNCPQLLFVSQMSSARCRVSPFLDHFKPCSDLLIPVEASTGIEQLMKLINTTLKLKPHERKPI